MIQSNARGDSAQRKAREGGKSNQKDDRCDRPIDARRMAGAGIYLVPMVGRDDFNVETGTDDSEIQRQSGYGLGPSQHRVRKRDILAGKGVDGGIVGHTLAFGRFGRVVTIAVFCFAVPALNVLQRGFDAHVAIIARA